MNDGLPPRWHTSRDTLMTLLHWLDETRQWAEATAGGPALLAAEEFNVPSSPPGASPEEAVASPDLYTLLAALTALRQEVKLQTRSARHDREQAAQMLEQLSRTVSQFDTMRQADARGAAAARQEVERATVEALIEAHDALSRAAREAERLVESTTTALWQWSGQLQRRQDGIARASPGPTPAALAVSSTARPRGMFSWLRGRWRGPAPAAGANATALPRVLQQFGRDAGSMADRLAGLATGYRLSVERLERLLAAYGVTPMACLGQPVDAEIMEVVQVIVDPAQPAGIVCDEVRRGYRRHGQVYRFAQVVATRATPAAVPIQRHEEK
jgi:molecular chaperone GrpE (heat shock protein)